MRPIRAGVVTRCRGPHAPCLSLVANRYEGQRDQLMQQSFNMEQAHLTSQNLASTLQTVRERTRLDASALPSLLTDARGEGRCCACRGRAGRGHAPDQHGDEEAVRKDGHQQD